MTIDAIPDYRGRDGYLCRRPNSWTGLVFDDAGACIRSIAGCGTKRQALALAQEAAAATPGKDQTP